MSDEQAIVHVPPCPAAEQFFQMISALASILEAKLPHLMLPISEAPALLSLLNHNGITGAAIFAGYYGAARAVMERYLGRMP